MNACTGKPAHPATTFNVQRMSGLEAAAGVLKQQPLADALGIDARSLRAKLSAERGVSNADLISAAGALDLYASKVTALADRLRAEAV